jgi:regulator of RNase E activity RraA
MSKVIAFLLLVVAPSVAQKPFNTPLPQDHPVPARVLTNRQSYSAINEILKRERVEVSDAQLEELKKHQLEGLWGAMGEYRETNYVRGFKTTRPGERLVGRALTMRFLPSRPDLAEAAQTLAVEADWDRRFYIRAGEEAKPNDVIVVDLGGTDGGNFFGDVTALGIKMRDTAGVVIDGGTRDLAELGADNFAGFPVFARFFDIHGNTWVGTEWNVPIRVGEVAVIPGDIVVADEGGILFIPPRMVAQVLKTVNAGLAREDYERSLIKQKKHLIREVYPLHPKLQEEFEKTQPN